MMALPAFGLVALGLVGLLVGSFLNVVIVRLPERGSLVSPPSHCVACGTPIKPWDNVPIVSWFLLRGRCRSCGEEFGFAYVLVEAGNALLWVVLGLRFGASWALLPMLLLASTLLVHSVIDLESYTLYDRITFPVLGVSVVLIGVASALEGDPTRIGMAILGGVGYSVALGIPALILPRGMGLGDVKLALLLGLFLGWVHPLLIFFSLILACLLGIVVGVGYMAIRRQSSEYPFGPWLALGCLAAIVWAQPLLDVYHATTAPFLAGP